MGRSHSLWTLINVVLAVGVFRRAPAVAIFLLPTFAHEALIAAAFLMRKPLVKQSEGWVPRAAAYAATFMTPVFFFFSSVMDKLGRSASLIALGILFVAGSWYWEKLRRRLVAQVQPGGAQ